MTKKKEGTERFFAREGRREGAGVSPAGYRTRGKKGKRVLRGVASAWNKRNPSDPLDHSDPSA